MPVVNRLLLVFVIWEIAVLLTVPARAQDIGTPRERALMERVSIEINSGLNCATNVAVLQDKVRELEQKLKATEKKD